MFLGCSFVPKPYVFLLALVPHCFFLVALYMFYFLMRWIWSLLFSFKISWLLKVCYSFVPISIKFPLSSAGVILDLDQIYRLIWERIENFQVVPCPRVFLPLLRSFSERFWAFVIRSILSSVQFLWYCEQWLFYSWIFFWLVIVVRRKTSVSVHWFWNWPACWISHWFYLVHLNLLHFSGEDIICKRVTLLFVPFLRLLIPEWRVCSAGTPRTLLQSGDGALPLLS